MNPNMSQMRRSTTTVAERSRIAWRMRLTSAARTAAACATVGVATLYGPKFLASHIKFSAFSYLTAVLIVSDATLGDTMRGGWHAIIATVQVVPVAMLVRWFYVIPEGGIPASASAAVVAVASFLVALPGCTPLTAKKLAFGQIVLICSNAVQSDNSSEGFTHPLYVAASTALGVLASILALLLPYPGLACHKVQKLCRIYAENASERMDIYMQALSATDKRTKMELISQVKPLSATGAKLLQSIKILEDGLRWEKPWRKVSPRERLESMEQQMRGIEYSLVSSAAIPLQAMDQEQLSEILPAASTRIQERIEQFRCYSPFHPKIESDAREFMENPSSSLESNLSKLKHGWLVLSFSCISMFLNDTVCSSAASRKLQTPAETSSIITRFKHWIQKLISYKRLEFACKCSLSLSIAMLLGLTFDKENGCWAGLTIAISFVTGKQAIFTVANSRVQGTAIGSVYGVICCFIFHYEELRLVALLPWMICTSFLRYSKMYGTTGGVSAAIGALVILGRKNYGDPNEFAIYRLTEVFIGLTAFLAVEIFLQPTRAATLAKNNTHLTLCALQECIKETGMLKNQTTSDILDLTEKQRSLNCLLSELKQYVADADLEPDFWYLPFRTSCYQKLVGSLSNIIDMLYFITHNFEMLSKLSETEIGSKFQEQIKKELEILQETLSSSHVLLEQAITNEFQAGIEEEMESGKLCNRGKRAVLIEEQKETEWIAGEEDEDDEDDRNLKGRVIQCLSAARFCINSVVKELEDIEICRREIDQWQK